MKFISRFVVIVQLAAGVAHAQTFNDLQIELGAYTARDDGGDKPVGIWLGTGPLVVGRTTAGTFSFSDTCDGFAVSAVRSDVTDDATTAWPVDVTPLRVAGNAITFRLRWSRLTGLRQQLVQALSSSTKPVVMPGEDVELTMRPGESRQVDSVRVPAGAKTVHGRPCGSAASIRVLVDNHPSEFLDRRLVGAELWLIEQLPNGTATQRGQALSVRGVPNRPIKFYFDSIPGLNASLDISGTIAARPDRGPFAVSVETRYRWTDNGFWQTVNSEAQLKPEETVDIRLPKLGADAGPFANREFSIRIRARQIR